MTHPDSESATETLTSTILSAAQALHADDLAHERTTQPWAGLTDGDRERYLSNARALHHVGRLTRLDPRQPDPQGERVLEHLRDAVQGEPPTSTFQMPVRDAEALLGFVDAGVAGPERRAAVARWLARYRWAPEGEAMPHDSAHEEHNFDLRCPLCDADRNDGYLRLVNAVLDGFALAPILDSEDQPLPATVCGQRVFSIDSGRPCIYAPDHPGDRHQTANGFWWLDDEPENDASLTPEEAERWALVQDAMKAILPNVRNETAAWNVWNNLASNRRFTHAIRTLTRD